MQQSDIQKALENSLIGDNAKLQESNEKLSEWSKIQGYCTTLMEIINDNSLKSDIKQAALIQLKNTIKTKWKPKNENLELSGIQKGHIREALIRAIVLCANQYKLIKIYKEVLTIIIGYDYENWMPLNQILAILGSSVNLAPAFHCIIAICANFQYSVSEKEKLTFNLFLKELLPVVLKIVTSPLSTPEIVYLSLKILWKAVHYEMSLEIKMLALDWMGVLAETIMHINPELQSKLDEFQHKGTPQFYYYHSKKWGTKILMRFFQKHGKSTMFGKVHQENLEFSTIWYQNYGLKLCEIIFKHLQEGIPTIKKIRCFQLKIIQAVLNDRPDILESSARIFQYQVLLNYMVVTKEDNDLALNDVVEYMRASDETGMMAYTNVKRVATQVWNAFLQMYGKFDRENNIYTPGPLFEENINFMFEKIKSDNLMEKEMGMFLFCENRITINRVQAIKQQMPGLIGLYVVPLLSDPNLLIRSRANEMIYEFGKQIHDVAVLGKCLEGVYTCLINDSSPLVKIKAAIAMNSLVWHSEAKNFLKDYLKTILTAYLQLIQKYDLEQVISALEYFIGDFSDSIGPFAIELFQYLLQLFSSMFKKDMQLNQNQDYGSDMQLAASGCIKTMTQIIDSPLDPQIRIQIQPLVLQLCAFLFTNQSYDYHEDMLYLLRVYLVKVDKISPHCWFFYQVIVYFIVGIPNEQWKQVQSSPMPDINKKILAHVKDCNNVDFLEFVMPILRNYLGKSYPMILSQKDEFKTNITNLILYLAVQIYKKGLDSDLSGEIHLDSCSILLVYLVQTFPPQMTKIIFPQIWNICKFNISKASSKYIRQITSQLISVLTWKHGPSFLQIILNENNLPTVVKNLATVSLSLEDYHERKRVILGICSYLLMVHDQEILLKHVPELARTLFRFIKNNCIARLLPKTEDEAVKKQLQELREKEVSLHDSNDEEDDMWDQEYDDRHCSVLKSVNELAAFKETMQKLNTDNQKLCQALTGSLQPGVLQLVQNLLEKALPLPEH